MIRSSVLLALLAVVGCATEESPCETAAAQLTTCSDDQRTAFVESCQSAGDDALVSLDETDAQAACAVVPDDGKQDADHRALMGTCIAAMYGTKWSVTGLSPAGTPLGAYDKEQLRPLFGDLVDQVRVSADAAVTPVISIAGHTLFAGVAGMTFGDRIFLSPQLSNPARGVLRLMVLTHEMVHAQQAAARGGFYGFAKAYCSDMIAVNFDYERIGLEIAADRVARGAYASYVRCSKLSCL